MGLGLKAYRTSAKPRPVGAGPSYGIAKATPTKANRDHIFGEELRCRRKKAANREIPASEKTPHVGLGKAEPSHLLVAERACFLGLTRLAYRSRCAGRYNEPRPIKADSPSASLVLPMLFDQT